MKKTSGMPRTVWTEDEVKLVVAAGRGATTWLEFEAMLQRQSPELKLRTPSAYRLVLARYDDASKELLVDIGRTVRAAEKMLARPVLVKDTAPVVPPALVLTPPTVKPVTRPAGALSRKNWILQGVLNGSLSVDEAERLLT